MSVGQMVALTNGEKCQKHFCIPGQWGAPVLLLAASASHGTPWPSTPWFLGMRAIGTGSRTIPPGVSLYWREAALHWLNYLAVSLRSAPKSQNLNKIFSVFSSWMAHMAFAINTTPKISKIALNWKLLVSFQNHNLTMLHLILITSITLSAW